MSSVKYYVADLSIFIKDSKQSLGFSLHQLLFKIFSLRFIFHFKRVVD